MSFSFAIFFTVAIKLLMGIINDFMSISFIEGWGPRLACLVLNPQHPATEPIEQMCNQQVNEKREDADGV